MHRTLKARAALAGMSLSDYLLQELKQVAERPTLDEMRRRIASRAPVELPQPAADMLREERENRTRHLLDVIGAPVRRKAGRSRG